MPGRALHREKAGVAHAADEQGRKIYFWNGFASGQGLLLPSKLGHILTELPELLRCEVPAGTFLRYKGRSYCWTAVSERGEIRLTEDMLAFLRLEPGMRLLSIRSSDIAFTMGAKGPLLEKAARFQGEIPLF